MTGRLAMASARISIGVVNSGSFYTLKFDPKLPPAAALALKKNLEDVAKKNCHIDFSVLDNMGQWVI